MRVFYNNNEITKEIERLDESVYKLNYVSGSYIYVATDFPFNHVYFTMGDVKNEVSANMKVEYYGSSWNEVVELRDNTNGLTKSDYIEFTPNRNVMWSLQTDSTEIGLTKVVYEKYWTRISFDQTLTTDVDLSFAGNKFSDDQDLFSEYPIFSNSDFMSAFKLGKDSWEEQHIKSSEMINMDLIKKGVILGPEQLLERRKFIGASVCKTAEIIFTAFGNDYLEQKTAAREEYFKRLDLSQYSADVNNDGIVSPIDVQSKVGWLSR